MWDGNTKLFDLSADSLKQSQQQAQVPQPPPNLLQTDPNSPSMPNDPFGKVLTPQQPQAAQPSSGFKPGIDTSTMMNQMNMAQMNQMNQMQMNPMQMQQMAMMRQQQMMMQGAGGMQMGMGQQMNPMM